MEYSIHVDSNDLFSVFSLVCSVVFTDNVSRMFLYFYYLQRLHKTFSGKSILIYYIFFSITHTYIGSVFRMSTKEYKTWKTIIVSLLTITGLFCVFGFTMIVEFERNIFNINGISWRIISLTISVIPASVVDSFFGIILMYLLIKRLRIISLHMDNKSKQGLNKLIKKLTILASTAVISTNIIVGIFSLFPGQLYSIIFVDIIINSCCLCFSFKKYTNYYNKYCFLCIKLAFCC